MTKQPAVVVTGAASNIGREIACLLSGQKRVIALDRDEEGLDELRTQIGCEISQADFGKLDGSTLGRDLVGDFGPISWVVNNVGVRNDENFLRSSRDELLRVFNTNLFCPWLMTREIVANMIEEGRGGGVVWISSVHDRRRVGYPAYSSSKAAIAMLVGEMAAELGRHSIRVNAVSPGAISDGHHHDLDAEQNVPFEGRSGTPHEVAQVVNFLLSDAAGYVSGANWVVDGGLSTHSWVGK